MMVIWTQKKRQSDKNMFQVTNNMPSDQSNAIGKSKSPSTISPHLIVSEERRRRVRFQRDGSCNSDVVVHHDTVAMSEEEFRAYFMQPQDFERCNESTKEAVQKWILHKKENTPMDEVDFSIRGLEEVLDHMKNAKCPSQGREWQRLNHVQVVLNEVRQQRLNNSSSTTAPLNEEQIRCVSERSSTAALERAIMMAEKDRMSHSSSSSATSSTTSSTTRSSLDVSETRRFDNVERTCNPSVQSPPPPPPPPKELTASNKKARPLFGFITCF